MRNIEILMSTYNGARYVGRQIDSILNQKNVDVHITIRDDGSQDDTVSVLRQYENEYPRQIKIYVGENIGHKRSFLMLLSLAIDADYYAFSDQDDIWEDNKLESALYLIENKDTILYVSNLAIYNANLEILDKTSFSQQHSSIYSAFTRHRYAGCTYVFDRNLMRIVSVFSKLNLPSNKMPSHDSLVCRCAYACGDVVVDENSYIKHIRYVDSVTAGGNGFLKRLKLEWNGLKSASITSNTALLILDNVHDYIRKENIAFLQEVAFYKRSLYNWFVLLTDSKMRCGIPVCDLKCKLEVLIRRY